MAMASSSETVMRVEKNRPIEIIDLTADTTEDSESTVEYRPAKNVTNRGRSSEEQRVSNQQGEPSVSTLVHRSPHPVVPAKRRNSARSPNASPTRLAIRPSSHCRTSTAGRSSASGTPTARGSTVSSSSSRPSKDRASGPSGAGPRKPRILIKFKFSQRPSTPPPPELPGPQAMAGVEFTNQSPPSELLRSQTMARAKVAPSTPPPQLPRPQSMKGVEVVIPSPLRRRKPAEDDLPYPKNNPYYGISEEKYPTKSVEAARAARLAYPTRETNLVKRSDVSLFSKKSVPPDVRHVRHMVSPSLPKNPKDLLRESLNKKLQSIAGPAITFNINDEKLASLSSGFGFLNDYVLLEGVERVDEGFNSGCNCDGPVCDPMECDCLFEEEETDSKIITYHRVNGQILLHPSFLTRRSKIVECCELCSCKGNCWNTVVQGGRQVRFEIFDTGNRGLGLRSLDPIVAGQYIDRYLGEVLTQKEADARELSNDNGQSGQSYLFILDWNIDHDEGFGEGDEFIDEDKECYVVDGQKFGSATRFINHSCDPNCKIITVSTAHHGDDKLYYLAFFAIRDIPAGTEMTFDYNPGWDGKLAEGEEPDPEAVRCLCKAEICRGQLWRNARKKGHGNTIASNANTTFTQAIIRRRRRRAGRPRLDS